MTDAIKTVLDGPKGQLFRWQDLYRDYYHAKRDGEQKTMREVMWERYRRLVRLELKNKDTVRRRRTLAKLTLEYRHLGEEALGPWPDDCPVYEVPMETTVEKVTGWMEQVCAYGAMLPHWPAVAEWPTDPLTWSEKEVLHMGQSIHEARLQKLVKQRDTLNREIDAQQDFWHLINNGNLPDAL